MNFASIKKIHCLGIGGIGVSAAAKFFLAQGRQVSGSDLARSEITEDLEKRGVKIFYGHQPEKVAEDIDLAIYSPAVPPDNPERLRIRRLKDYKIIEELSYPEFLGELSKEYYTIAVSGTHGKSTTTALIGLILEAAGFDPLVIVGSRVSGWELGNIRLPVGQAGSPKIVETRKGLVSPNGQSNRRRYFVVEACEHQANMLKIHPQAAVVTNIEEDHLDYYKNLKNIVTAFGQFIQSVPADGLVVMNGDDGNSLNAFPEGNRRIKIKKFGLDKINDYRATDLKIKDGRQYFNIQYPISDILAIQLNIPGLFNVYNSLVAATVALELGAPIEVCQKVLAEFRGLWRRFEKVGEYHGALIISDFGHHPTAIRETVKGAREFYPGRRIVLVFQPHHHNRTKRLFEDFVKVLPEPDVLILSDIYEVAGREAAEDQDMSSLDLVKRIKGLKVKGLIEYGGDLEKTEDLTRRIIKEGDVVVVMGAGDIDKMARRLIK